MDSNEERKQADLGNILLASGLSGIIAGLFTNPIDVYQINKQMNPNFHLRELSLRSLFLGVKIRVLYILIGNILMFYFLERIGCNYFNVKIED